MPPKKKATRNENNISLMEKDKEKPMGKKKPPKNIDEPAARMNLRPRQPVTTDLTKQEAKSKPKPKPRTKTQETNDDAENKKREPLKTKRGKKSNTNEKIENELEPPVKISKSEDENVDEDNALNNVTSIYEFTATDINGKDVLLEKYKGHVCIIVNVASRCGHTISNYKELVELFDKYGNEKGLQILAFPCNQFGSQEPGDSAKICEFAKKKNVKFDMFEKVNVNGKNAHPLWKFLKSQKEGPKGEAIDWNFTKFLINVDGEVVERYKPSVKPLAMLKDLEKLW